LVVLVEAEGAVASTSTTGDSSIALHFFLKELNPSAHVKSLLDSSSALRFGTSSLTL
jgi:hypothetical protein